MPFYDTKEDSDAQTKKDPGIADRQRWRVSGLPVSAAHCAAFFGELCAGRSL
jgi:hypothetical protein